MVLGLGASDSFASVVYSTGDFQSQNWTWGTIYSGGFASCTDQSTGGNPGTCMRIQTVMGSMPENGAAGYVHPVGKYNLVLNGPVSSISVQVQYDPQTDPIMIGRIIIFQGLNRYASVAFTPTAADTGQWQTLVIPPTPESGFAYFTVPGQFDYACHPDFTGWGDPMYVGFMAEGYSADENSIILYDNLTITIVPEPATLGLLALGALLMIRRRCMV